jgi:hypothetical protein
MATRHTSSAERITKRSSRVMVMRPTPGDAMGVVLCAGLVGWSPCRKNFRDDYASRLRFEAVRVQPGEPIFLSLTTLGLSKAEALNPFFSGSNPHWTYARMRTTDRGLEASVNAGRPAAG